MKISYQELRSTLRSGIQQTLAEAQGALRLLDVVRVKLILSKEKKVEEILTDVRIIKGVATVSQVEPMKRMENGSRVMEILITFDPGELDALEYIDAAARLMKKIPDVVTVVIKTLNNQPVRDASGQKKLVY